MIVIKRTCKRKALLQADYDAAHSLVVFWNKWEFGKCFWSHKPRRHKGTRKVKKWYCGLCLQALNNVPQLCVQKGSMLLKERQEGKKWRLKFQWFQFNFLIIWTNKNCFETYENGSWSLQTAIRLNWKINSLQMTRICLRLVQSSSE